MVATNEDHGYTLGDSILESIKLAIRALVPPPGMSDEDFK